MKTHVEFTTQQIVVPAPGSSDRETGADVEFRGIVRETERDHAITGLYYEAHVAMARLQIERILVQLRESSPCQCVWFIHRLGWVPVGEVSLYIRVQASHREPAFRFCMALIDQLKRDAPIWKLSAPPSGAAKPLPPGSE